MKHMKQMLALLMAVLLVLSLAACGNSTAKDSASTNTASEQTEVAAASDEASADAETSTPGEPPEGGPGGTPPDGQGGPGGTPPDGQGGPGGGPGGSSSADIDYSGAVEIASADTQSGQTYASSASDESALLISTSDDVTVSNPTVTKSGDSDGGDNCNFYGLNAAVLVKDGATATITGGTITSDASGANGVFCYGGNGGQNGASGDGTTVIIRDISTRSRAVGSKAFPLSEMTKEMLFPSCLASMSTVPSVPSG